MLLSFFGGFLNTVTKGRLWFLVLCYLGETETTFPRPPGLYGWAKEKSVEDLGDGSEAVTHSLGLGVAADMEMLVVPACPHLPLLYIFFLAEDPAYPQWLPLTASHVVDPRVAGHGSMASYGLSYAASFARWLCFASQIDGLVMFF